jgi:hypothetical protein
MEAPSGLQCSDIEYRREAIMSQRCMKQSYPRIKDYTIPAAHKVNTIVLNTSIDISLQKANSQQTTVIISLLKLNSTVESCNPASPTR